MGAVEANTIAVRRVPPIDYDGHPAYGGKYKAPGLLRRARALARLAPWVALVVGKRMLFFDRLPPLPDYQGPMGDGIAGRLASLPRYLPHLAGGLVSQLARSLSGPPPVSPAAGALLNRFRADGIAPARIPDEDLARLREQLAIPLAELAHRREVSSTTTFEGNQRWLNQREAGTVYSVLTGVLERCGLLGAAAGYLGRPVRITHLTLQVNDSRDAYQHDKFGDVGVPDPPSNYMHIDTSYDMVKCMIYLSEVNDRNGPFCYVPGTPRRRLGPIEGVLRRAVDRAGLAGYSPEARQAFMALPAPLRKKCTFGSDLAADSPAAAELVAAEYRFTSADGNACLFDNLGVHRGAIVQVGERRVLIANIA